ncbi:Putative NADP-dependent oxidoreductase YfmJ [Zhongshania aliphaticivorans]|uniref:NADP-dependent oxidoreductase YfmJ n=1 Tax=Zhongshania aliphaticivorans TaxID=1470434 RepID=A0A5S9N7L4_9GAMM|nr:NADP-dependent oxidoreductase [Zhongshania aliphaticivorans]CAA0079841.1 Putative NADP-dependent oxidoreductase YfmJ [Zhongshania aliphaticivorans]CAA0085954.1 Putative NADP-dependent oxidoreductase YfmJ [Zhongshania aliphaticivorans]
MTTSECQYWRFDIRPEKNINNETFSLQTRSHLHPEEGQIKVKNRIISMDATNRLWLGEREELYMEPVALGDSMKGFGLCEVVESKSKLFQKGQLVTALTEWAEYSILDAHTVNPFIVPDGMPLDLAFGAMSIAGPTAYHGLLNIAHPKPGETVVVTAASGAVGSLAGQIAKLNGCRVVGTAGSDDKCQYLTDELGFDAAINYREADFDKALAEACPQGIDIQFENVGGSILDSCLTLMNNGGRVVICGLISMYNSSQNVPGPYMFHNSIMKRLKIEGFVILDHAADFPNMQQYLARWLQDGSLKFKLHCHNGIEHASTALQSLYTGENNGKVLVKIQE